MGGSPFRENVRQSHSITLAMTHARQRRRSAWWMDAARLQQSGDNFLERAVRSVADEVGFSATTLLDGQFERMADVVNVRGGHGLLRSSSH
jgi:hypothetical protein